MSVTKKQAKKAKPAGKADATRFLHVPVVASFLQRVNVAATSKGKTVREYVSASLERSMTGK